MACCSIEAEIGGVLCSSFVVPITHCSCRTLDKMCYQRLLNTSLISVVVHRQPWYTIHKLKRLNGVRTVAAQRKETRIHMQKRLPQGAAVSDIPSAVCSPSQAHTQPTCILSQIARLLLLRTARPADNMVCLVLRVLLRASILLSRWRLLVSMLTWGPAPVARLVLRCSLAPSTKAAQQVAMCKFACKLEQLSDHQGGIRQTGPQKTVLRLSVLRAQSGCITASRCPRLVA